MSASKTPAPPQRRAVSTKTAKTGYRRERPSWKYSTAIAGTRTSQNRTGGSTSGRFRDKKKTRDLECQRESQRRYGSPVHSGAGGFDAAFESLQTLDGTGQDVAGVRGPGNSREIRLNTSKTKIWHSSSSQPTIQWEDRIPRAAARRSRRRCPSRPSRCTPAP